MLNRRLIALAGAIAILGAGTQASAYNVFVDPGGAIGAPGSLNASDTLILANTAELVGSELARGWDWTIFCTGCIVSGWTYNEVPASPPYVPPGNVFFFNTAFVAPAPSIPNGIGTDTMKSIGGFDLAKDASAGGNSTIGWVTVHITAASGSIATGFSAGEGFTLSGGIFIDGGNFNSASWDAIPEPGTAMLLALGLTGLGVMGRRNR